MSEEKITKNQVENIKGIIDGSVSTKVQIIKALHSFHNEVGSVLKNANNPFFKSKYADLNAFLEVVKAPLHNNGLIIVQSPIVNGLETTIYHTSGESISSQMKVEFPKDPQKIGIVITYFRRYMLQSMLFLNAEDDDGNGASGNNYDGKAENEKTQSRDELIRQCNHERSLIKKPSDAVKQFMTTIDKQDLKGLTIGLNKLKAVIKG